MHAELIPAFSGARQIAKGLLQGFQATVVHKHDFGTTAHLPLDNGECVLDVGGRIYFSDSLPSDSRFVPVEWCFKNGLLIPTSFYYDEASHEEFRIPSDHFLGILEGANSSHVGIAHAVCRNEDGMLISLPPGVSTLEHNKRRSPTYSTVVSKADPLLRAARTADPFFSTVRFGGMLTESSGCSHCSHDDGDCSHHDCSGHDGDCWGH